MRHMLSILTTLLLSLSVLAQNKTDIILKTNGEEMKGKVVEILDNDIKFTYEGETLVYSVKKSEIQKITFSSGRVQTFNAATTTSAPAQADSQPAATGDSRNKVAILPFTFTKDGQAAPEEVSMQVQNECYALLSRHSGVYTVLEPRRTDVLLNKANITRANIMNYTMDEIAKILGVEYIVDGMVTQNRTTQTSYGSSSYQNKNDKKDDDKKSSGSSSNYATTQQNYQSTLDLKIYNDKGATIYSQNRKAFWNTEDAYKSALEYLIKRCPLYSK